MLFIIIVIILSLFAFGFAWYIGREVFESFQTVGHSAMVGLSTTSATTTLVETFLTNAWTYLLIIALVGLSLWVYNASQKKGKVE